MIEPGRWALSPAYDLNPVPEIDRARTSKTPLSEEREEGSMVGALAVAGRFGINVQTAKTILHEVYAAVAAWRWTAAILQLKRATVEAYASAFEHDLMDEARKLLAK